MEPQRLHPEDIAAIAREIAGRLDDESLMDAADIAALTRYTQRFVAEHLSASPGFPRAIRLNSPNGTKRWRRQDVLDFLRSRAEGRGRSGARRKNADLD